MNPVKFVMVVSHCVLYIFYDACIHVTLLDNLEIIIN